jgi:N-acetylglutamate synthase
VSSSTSFTTGPELAARIEAHCVLAWPPTTVQHTDEGWVLRATPGLPKRGRSNHALSPTRPLEPGEYEAALARVADFASANGVACGVQIGPTEYHQHLIDDLATRGWGLQQDVIVMTADTQSVAASADPAFALEVEDSATPAWMDAWAKCEGRDDAQAHLESVFPLMAGSARFARSGERAVGVSVESDGIVGMFCLAVSPDQRRQGLGKALVRAMLAQHDAPLTYLQVFSSNTAGVALYESLGFREAYRYRHALAPVASLAS